MLTRGDVVVIHSTDGVENRYGCLGIVSGPASILMDGRYDLLVEDPSEQGFISTYHQDHLEVIDHVEGEPKLPKIPAAVITEFKKVCRALKSRRL